MVKVNAIGQMCPIPIIMAKNALKEIESGEVEIAVDNKTSLENLEKMSIELGYLYTVESVDDIFKIVITKNNNLKQNDLTESNNVVVLDSLYMGNGDKELGKILMKGFIYTLSEIEIIPKTILLYNEGVKLITKDSEVLEDLINLEKRGVEILACGTCLDFYKIPKTLLVGSVTNMYTIIERELKSDKVIKP